MPGIIKSVVAAAYIGASFGPAQVLCPLALVITSVTFAIFSAKKAYHESCYKEVRDQIKRGDASKALGKQSRKQEKKVEVMTEHQKKCIKALVFIALSLIPVAGPVFVLYQI